MNYLILILAFSAVAVTQMLAGGRHLALFLPACGILALAGLLSFWPRRRSPIPDAAWECLGASVLFFAVVTIRALFSPEEYLARKDLFTAMGVMALYLLVALNLTSNRMRLWFVGGLVVLGVADCAIGAVQFIKGQNFMPFGFLPRPDYGWRASGFYGYPNHLSGFLEMAGLMGLAVAFWSRLPSWVKMVAGYASLICLLGILPTGSRGGYISVAVGLMVFVLLSMVLVGKVASNRVVIFAVVGLVLIGGVTWGVYQLTKKSSFIQARADETLTVDASRMRMWQAAWKQSRLHPIVGTGSGTYLYFGRVYRNPAIQTDPMHAHDDYFELLAEYGVMGIIAMVVFLETHLRHGWNSFTDNLAEREDSDGLAGNTVALTIGALSATAACLTHCFLDFNLHMPANILTMAFVFGMLANFEEAEDAAPTPARPAFLRLALPALALWIAFQALPTLPAEYYSERSWKILSDWKYLTSPELTRQLEEFAREGLARDERNPDLHNDLAAALDARAVQSKDPQEQRALREQKVVEFQRVSELAPGDSMDLLNLAEALDGVQRFKESDPLFLKALQLDPNYNRVHLACAVHLQNIGKYLEALDQYQKAVNLGGGPFVQESLDQLTAKLKQPGRLKLPAPQAQPQ